jgi:hypothetical protein
MRFLAGFMTGAVVGGGVCALVGAAAGALTLFAVEAQDEGIRDAIVDALERTTGYDSSRVRRTTTAHSTQETPTPGANIFEARRWKKEFASLYIAADACEPTEGSQLAEVLNHRKDVFQEIRDEFIDNASITS